jgi:predicted RNase H-like nuclease
MTRKHERECIDICQDVGLTVLTVERRKRHMAVHCEEGFLVFPSTPSDHRWRLNMRATARRLGR